MNEFEHLSKIAKTDVATLTGTARRLSAATGRSGVLESLFSENNSLVMSRLNELGVSTSHHTEAEVSDALISKIEADNNLLFEALNSPPLYTREGTMSVVNQVSKIVGERKGFFLKEGTAVRLLKKNPPQNVLNHLNLTSVDDLLGKFDVYEIFSSLRFIEGSDWLNDVFFKEYSTLEPQDFEERAIIVRVLSEDWNGASQSFLQKKWHNVSHLKEMGIVFVLPVMLGISGELLRMVSLILHYLHEIPFYSGILRRVVLNNEPFVPALTSLLRGDVPAMASASNDRSSWLVVQRYLAKDDEADPRLRVPRLNPEAIHWQKATNDLLRLYSGLVKNGNAADMQFWRGIDWIACFAPDDGGSPRLVSYNLVDTVMSLVRRKDMIKYRYHQGEAFWNKFFISYFSESELESYASTFLLPGKFEI